MKEIARLHGIPKAIVSNRDSKSTSNFWKGLFKGFGSNLNMSTTYHLQQMGRLRSLIKLLKIAQNVCNGPVIKMGILLAFGRVGL